MTESLRDRLLAAGVHEKLISHLEHRIENKLHASVAPIDFVYTEQDLEYASIFMLYGEHVYMYEMSFDEIEETGRDFSRSRYVPGDITFNLFSPEETAAMFRLLERNRIKS